MRTLSDETLYLTYRMPSRRVHLAQISNHWKRLAKSIHVNEKRQKQKKIKGEVEWMLRLRASKVIKGVEESVDRTAGQPLVRGLR